MALYVEDQKSSLFEDSKPSSQVIGSVKQERMFISGDLSSYNLPEEFLKEKKEIPDFWKGFLFTVFCGFLMVILTFIVGLSVESQYEEDYEEIFFVSDGIETNISHQLNSNYDIEECWDFRIHVENSDININKKCWYSWKDDKITGKMFPIYMYEHDIEIGVLDFNASEIEINLPFEVSNNSIVRFSFEHWDYSQQESVINETIFVINETNDSSSFLVALPPSYQSASGLNLFLEISDPNQDLMINEWAGKQEDCWWYGSKCTFTVGKESEIGFVDLNSEILVMALEEPLPKGTSVIIEYDYEDDNEEIMVLFFWLPPILFVAGVTMMIYNKNSKMVGGAFTALFPVIIVTFILSIMIFEVFL